MRPTADEVTSSYVLQDIRKSMSRREALSPGMPSRKPTWYLGGAITNSPFEVCVFVAHRGQGCDSGWVVAAWDLYLFEGSAGAVLHTRCGPVRAWEARAVQAAIEDARRPAVEGAPRS